MVNDNRATFFQNDAAFQGRPVPARQVIHDVRGFVAELLCKAINKNALEEEISAEDKERMLAFVRNFGALAKDYSYRGSSRAGYDEAPGAGHSRGRLRTPLSLKELLRSDFWQYQLHFSERFEHAPTVLQPVGGMDRIAYAFAERLAGSITYGAVVKEIRKSGDGVRVIYADETGRASATEADYAICTIPLSHLKAIPSDFSPDFKAAMAACYYVKAAKIAFQADRRFWEEDYNIYGGITWTSRDITQIWYPSAGFHAAKGVLIGAYIWSDDIGDSFGHMTPEQRLEAAVTSGEKIHSGYRANVSRGIAVSWHKIPYSEGAWSEWGPDDRLVSYPILNQPDGPIHLAGEHLSYLSSWQEGAVLSAHSAVRAIAERAKARRG